MVGQCKQRYGNSKNKLKKPQILEIKNIVTVTKMKIFFLIGSSKLDMVEEGISEYERVSIENLKTEKQREQKLKNKTRVQKNCRTTIKGITYEKLNNRKRRKK